MEHHLLPRATLGVGDRFFNLSSNSSKRHRSRAARTILFTVLALFVSFPLLMTFGVVWIFSGLGALPALFAVIATSALVVLYVMAIVTVFRKLEDLMRLDLASRVRDAERSLFDELEADLEAQIGSGRPTTERAA